MKGAANGAMKWTLKALSGSYTNQALSKKNYDITIIAATKNDQNFKAASQRT